MVGATAVQTIGHLSLVACVLLDVGVQHQERHPAHLGYPHLGEEGTPGERDLDSDRAAVSSCSKVNGNELRDQEAGSGSCCQPAAFSDCRKYPCR